MDENELTIIRKIAYSNLVHYTDLISITGKSRKTVAKYLNHIGMIAQSYNVTLVRQRNVGIYFKGDVSKFINALDSQPISSSMNTRNSRIVYLLSRLLLLNERQTFRELANSVYISESTLKTDLKVIKRLISHTHAELQVTREGVFIAAGEQVRRQLIAELLSAYWGNAAFISEKRDGLCARIEVPKELKNFFDNDTISTVVSALNEFEDDSKLSLSDYEYQSLAVHLIIAIKRIKNNEFLPLDYNNSGKIEKNTELLVQILEHHFMLKIPTVEKGYINIHILAIQGTQSTSNYSINEHKNEIFYSNRKIVDFLLENLNQYDKTLIQNLTLHLVPAMKRLSLGLSLRNPYATDTKKFFPIAYDEATSLGKNIKNEFNIDLNDDELAYIALHIEAFIERSNRRVSAVIVCSSGLGTASLIEQRISRIFSNSLVITRVTSLQQLKQSPITEDLVISTINIKIPSVPVVVVTPFLDSSSIKRVQEAINHVHNSCPNSTSFTAMIHRDLIFFDGQQRTTKDVIQ